MTGWPHARHGSTVMIVNFPFRREYPYACLIIAGVATAYQSLNLAFADRGQGRYPRWGYRGALDFSQRTTVTVSGSQGLVIQPIAKPPTAC